MSSCSFLRVGPLLCLLCLLASQIQPIFAEEIDDSIDIHPWRLSVPSAQIADLQSRIRNAILPTDLEDVNDWSYGTPLSFVAKMREYWLEKYDWSAREEYINRALGSQYMTKIDGLNIHYAHVKSANESAVPLVVSHGWPGSVLECTKLIPLLTARFHIVCPSIPGYFFSEAPRKTGFDTQKTAKIFASLMQRLGYSNYLAQGGDWGSEVSRWLGIVDNNCSAVHVNMVIAQAPFLSKDLWGFFTSIRTFFQIILPKWFFSESELNYIERTKKYAIHESAYLAYHSTLPQSISFALSDSPLGLAAYLWEKYYYWSDLNDPASLIGTFTEDELIDFVMVYWVSNSFASSIRLYKETVPQLITTELPYQPKPTAVAAFKDIIVMPREWASHLMNIVRWTPQPRGGHFAALEAPDLLAQDIINFADSIREHFVVGYRPPKRKIQSIGFGDTDEL